MEGEIAIRVKTIDQDTFDEVVRENIQEFGMELSEAIDDATDQFKSQNVELSNIVKTLSLNENSEPYHPVIAAVNKLKSVYNADTVDSIVSHADQLDTIRSECDKDISYRILAAKNNAYPVVMSCCQSVINSDIGVLIKALTTLSSLCKGQPDLFSADNIPFVLELFSTFKSDNEVLVVLLKFVRNVCIKHENNRQQLIGSKVVTPIVDVMKDCDLPAVIRECCGVLRTLTLDDDIRVPYGKAHDHAKHIASDHDVLKLLCTLISRFGSNADVLADVLSTLGKLTVRNEYCQEVMESNGLKLALTALINHVKHQALVKNALLLIKTTAGNDDVRRALILNGGAPTIINAVESYIGQSAAVVEAGCISIAMLAMRSPDNCTILMQSGAANLLVQAMKVHADHRGVQKQSCMAIRNLICRSKQFIPEFVDQDIEELINAARIKHKIEDEAKAALRDLGCKIDLKELWKGEHGDVCKS